MSHLSIIVDKAIEVLQKRVPFDGYHLAFSGGKDSIVCLKLLQLANVKFSAFYSITTVDHPELLRFIKTFYPIVNFSRPSISMFQLISKKGLPLRHYRYCCQHLKEYSGISKLCITGIRKEESKNRSLRSLYEIDNRKKMDKCYLNLIIYWSSSDVWEFIRLHKLITPDFYYTCHTSRGGCIGCPMGSPKSIRLTFERFPKFKQAYIKSISAYMANGGYPAFPNADDVFCWWVSGLSVKNYFSFKKQTSLNF